MISKFLTCFLIVFLVLSMLPFSVNAQEDSFKLELTTDKEYFYVKGQTIQVNATSNMSVAVNLLIFWNWKTFTNNQLVYNNTRMANATWNLPTTNMNVGYYTLTATGGNQTITIYRTLIHTTGYNSANLPFTYDWQGINYTFEGRTFSAKTEDDYLNITYPKIPVETNTQLLVNNMSFLIRLSGISWDVDISYWAMYSGIKWIINGTFENAGTYEFKCASNPLKNWAKRLNRFQSDSYLVFDWEDLARAKDSFSWSETTKTLSVDIPAKFLIDPYVFEDGFESGNFSAWTGNSVSGFTQAVSTDYAHHGTRSLKAVGGNGASEYHELYKTITAATAYYIRGYIYFETLPTNNVTAWVGPTFLNSADLNIAGAGIRKQATDYNWCAINGAPASNVAYHANISTINPDTWYCLEIYSEVHATAGVLKLWVDGNLVVNQSGLITNGLGNIARGSALSYTEWGAWNPTDITLYHDCYVIDSSYIGPESAGETTLNKFGSIALAYAVNKVKAFEFARSTTITLAYSVLSFYRSERGFSFFGTIPLAFSVLSKYGSVRFLSYFGSASFTFSETFTRALAFRKQSTVPLTFNVAGIYSQAVQGFLYFFGTMFFTFSMSTQRTIDFNRQGAVPLTFIMNGAYLRLATLLNLFGTVVFTLAVNMAKTFSFNIFSAETLAFTVNSLSTFIGLPVLLYLFGIIPLAFTVASFTPFSLPTAADMALALGAVAFVLAVTAIAFTVIRRRKEE